MVGGARRHVCQRWTSRRSRASFGHRDRGSPVECFDSSAWDPRQIACSATHQLPMCPGSLAPAPSLIAMSVSSLALAPPLLVMSVSASRRMEWKVACSHACPGNSFPEERASIVRMDAKRARKASLVGLKGISESALSAVLGALRDQGLLSDGIGGVARRSLARDLESLVQKSHSVWLADPDSVVADGFRSHRVGSGAPVRDAQHVRSAGRGVRCTFEGVVQGAPLFPGSPLVHHILLR